MYDTDTKVFLVFVLCVLVWKVHNMSEIRTRISKNIRFLSLTALVDEMWIEFHNLDLKIHHIKQQSEFGWDSGGEIIAKQTFKSNKWRV